MFLVQYDDAALKQIVIPIVVKSKYKLEVKLKNKIEVDTTLDWTSTEFYTMLLNSQHLNPDKWNHNRHA